MEWSDITRQLGNRWVLPYILECHGSLALATDQQRARIAVRGLHEQMRGTRVYAVLVLEPNGGPADALRGLFVATVNGKPEIVEYEPDSDLRDTEQVPLLEDGGIEAFICREVLPYIPEAWIKEDATKIGYEVSFTRRFYKPQRLRTLEEISADILAIEKEAEGLLDGLLKGATR